MAGWSTRVTAENKSKLLPFPLVDSEERDLRKAARWRAEVKGTPMPSPPRVPEEGPSDRAGGEGGDGEAGGGDGEGSDAGGVLAVANEGQDETSRRQQHLDILYAEHRELMSVAFHGGVAALKRLCFANKQVASGSFDELITRLVNAKVHGRPDMCPECYADLHLVCTPDDLQPNEVSRLECRAHSDPHVRGHHIPGRCTWSVDFACPSGLAGSFKDIAQLHVDRQRALRLKRSPLVDSSEGDLAAATTGDWRLTGDEGGEPSWAPANVDQLLLAIEKRDYGVSDDRSSKVATPAHKAYNAEARIYDQVQLKKGRPLSAGFWIVKVCAACCTRPSSLIAAAA